MSFARYRSWIGFTVLAFTVSLLRLNIPVFALSSKVSHHSTPRYLDQYTRAKEGIDAEERALQARLHAEISNDFHHLDGDSGLPKKSEPEKHKSAIAELRRHAHARRKVAAAATVVRHRLRVKRLAQHRLVQIAQAAKKPRAAKPDLASAGAPGAPGHHPTPLPPAPHFDIATVHRFDPGQSLSFARELFETFALSYADTSLMTGYVGRDIVQLGAPPPPPAQTSARARALARAGVQALLRAGEFWSGAPAPAAAAP